MAVTLLTVRSAAARLGIGYSTLKQWIYQGRVRTPPTAGRHHRIPDAGNDRLVARETEILDDRPPKLHAKAEGGHDARSDSQTRHQAPARRSRRRRPKSRR